MARFEVNKPIETQEPQVVVDGGLPAGQHLFQLIVEDSSGLESAPDLVRINITPVILR